MPHPDPTLLEAVDAVLFDAGGTLVELDYAFIADCLRRHGHEVTVAALRLGESRARRGVDAQAGSAALAPDARRRASYFEQLLAGAEVPRPVCAPVVETLEAHHAGSNLWRIPVQGAAETLAGLRARGLQTAVISNSDGRVASLLASLGLAEHVGLIVDSHDEGVEKPDPEIFRRALARLGVGASRSVYVGDIYSIDVVGARAAGLSAVLLDPFAAYADADCATIPQLTRLLEGSRAAAR